MKLYMIMIGCRPKGRYTEQHDIFFGIGNSVKELIPQMKEFWPEAKGNFHIDAWREVNFVDNYKKNKTHFFVVLIHSIFRLHVHNF